MTKQNKLTRLLMSPNCLCVLFVTTDHSALPEEAPSKGIFISESGALGGDEARSTPQPLVGSWDGADVGAQKGTWGRELQGYRKKAGEEVGKQSQNFTAVSLSCPSLSSGTLVYNSGAHQKEDNLFSPKPRF